MHVEFDIPRLRWNWARRLWIYGTTLLAAIGAISLLVWLVEEKPTGVEGWSVATAYVGMLWGMGLVIAFATVPGTVIPARFQTVRDIALPTAFARANPGKWTREAVLEKVKALAAEMSRTSVEKIDESTRFYEDLDLYMG